MNLPAKPFVLTLAKKERLTSEITAFYFSKPDGFNFLSGQYLRLTLPHEGSDDRGTNRFFTISSAPEEDQICITTRKGESSFKHALFQLESGAKVSCYGPIGRFTLEEA
jgi:ferredoxin-NADP reductase